MLEVQTIYFSDTDRGEIGCYASKNRMEGNFYFVFVNKIDGGTKIAICKGKIAKYID